MIYKPVEQTERMTIRRGKLTQKTITSPQYMVSTQQRMAISSKNISTR